MKKTGRLITVLLVLVVALALFYPTIKWYCFVPQVTKDLATGSNVQIKEYSRGQAAKDVRELKAMVTSDANAELPSQYKYLSTLAKENYKTLRKDKPSTWNVAAVLNGFSSESALFTAVENHYRSALMSVKTLSGNVLQLGLDLKGGMSILLDANRQGFEEKLGHAASEAEVTEAVKQDIEILNNRIDQFGVTEPDIRLQGSDQILIEIPGATDPERVNSFLRGKGSLTFQIVDNNLTTQLNSYFKENPSAAYNADGSIAQPDFVTEGKIATGYYQQDSYGIDELMSFVVLNKEVSLDGSHLESAQTATNGITGQPVVNFQLDSEGGNMFYALTSAHVGDTLAVVMDGRVKSMASIREPINSSVQISGFSQKEADDLAIVLKTAALPIELTVSSQQSVGATLGDDAVAVGIKAIAIGFALVIIFMFAYYGLSGLVADFALFLNLFIMISVLSAFHFTVTLTGIAGLILTLGMSVDANVIIYERIKEELALGKSAYASVQAGFGKAFWTIMDSNITTIIAALVLSQLGSSSVKGFAITLAVGIAASLFTALFVSHLVFDYAVKDSPKSNVSISWRKR